MTFRELLRGAQKATRRAIDQVEVQSVPEDELLAWFQLKKELLVVMTMLLQLDALDEGIMVTPPRVTITSKEVNA